MCPIWSRSCVIVTSLCLALFGGAALAQVPSTSSGQTYPNKPIRLMLPFPAGSPSDILGRALGQKLSEQLGENVVADNRSGAGGNLGISLAAKSPPDGYTILLTSPTIAISPDIIVRLNREITKALDAPDLRERLIASGIDPWPGTPEQSASLVRSETARYASIIKSLGLRLD